MNQGDTTTQLASSVPARAYRPVLVDMSVAMHVLGIDSESVRARVDCGELMWVWDVAAVIGGRRELRFWFGEILDLNRSKFFNVEEVIDLVIGYPTEQRLRATTVANALMLNRSVVCRFIQTGQLRGDLEGHTQWVTRQSFRHFLTRRLV